MVLIIATLSVFGFGALTWFANNDPVAVSVNGEQINTARWQSEIQRQRSSIANQGNPARIAHSKTIAFEEQVLSEMVVRELIRQTATLGGWVITDPVVDDLIRANSEFQIDGRYDVEVFTQALSAAGFTATEYRKELDQTMLVNQLSTGISGTDFVTKMELNRAINLTGEERDISWLVLKAEILESSVVVMPEEVSAHYDDYQTQYVIAEKVVVEYIELRQDDLIEQVEVMEGQILAAYKAEQLVFVAEEQRQGSHILLTVDEERSTEEAIAELLKLKAEVEAGTDFSALAKKHSADSGSATQGGDLGMAGKGQFVAPFEEALWALEVDELSEPVVTQFGVHLIKLVDTTLSTFLEYEEVKQRLKSNIAREKASELFTEQRLRLSEISYESGDLKPVSESLDLPIQKTVAFSRDENTVDDSNSRSLVVYPAFREAAFSEEVLEQQHNSPLLELEEGVVAVIRLLERIPGRQPDLEEVTSEITSTLRQQAAQRKAALRINVARDQLLAGASKDTVADELSLSWIDTLGAKRDDPRVPEVVLKTAFEAGNPPADEMIADIVIVPDVGVALLTVANIHPGDADELQGKNVIDREAQALQSIFGRASLNVFRAILLGGASVKK